MSYPYHKSEKNYSYPTTTKPSQQALLLKASTIQLQANIRINDAYGRLCAESERLLNYLLLKSEYKQIQPVYKTYLLETTDNPLNMMMNVESYLQFFQTAPHIAKTDGFKVPKLPKEFEKDVENWMKWVKWFQQNKNTIDPKLHVCLEVLSEVIGQLASGKPPTGMPESLSEKIMPQTQKDQIAKSYVSTNQKSVIGMVNDVHKLDEEVTKQVQEAALNDKNQKASAVPILNVAAEQNRHSEQKHDSNIGTDQLAPTDLLSASLEDIKRSIGKTLSYSDSKEIN